MSRASNLIGKPIITRAGEELDTIDDVILDPDTHHILCFTVNPGGWEGGAKILAWSNKNVITADAVIISSPEQVVLARRVPRIQAILEDTQIVIGKKIRAPEGQVIGVLSDVFFDSSTGEIDEYEITRFPQSINSRRSVILRPQDTDFEMNHNASLTVSPTTAELIIGHTQSE